MHVSQNPKKGLKSFAVVVSFMVLVVTGVFAGTVSATTTSGMLSIVAGSGTYGPPTAGSATISDLAFPYGVAIDSSGNLYIADYGNNVVEKVTSAGQLSVIAGNGTQGVVAEGTATATELDSPEGVAVDSSGNVYIADSGNNVIEKVTPTGQLSIFAGTGTCGALPAAGTATNADLCNPSGVAVDSSGNVYIADSGNNVIEKVTPMGQLSIIAGTGTAGAPSAGLATSSNLFLPFGVAVDSSDDVYIADEYNQLVEKVTSAGQLSIIAGTGTPGAPSTGLATSSDLYFPAGVAVDSAGNVYIADYANNLVEKVTPDGQLSIFAGTGTAGAPSAGLATSSDLDNPVGVAIDSSGSLYIGDSVNNVIEKVTAPLTVPGAPTNVVVTAGHGQVVVSWTAPNSDGGTPITDYSVQYSTNGGASWLSASLCSGTNTSCTVTGLMNGTGYLFRVAATNSVGTGAPSTNSATATPTSPAVLAATGSNTALLLSASAVLLLSGGLLLGGTRRRVAGEG